MTYEEYFHNRTLSDIMEEYGEQRDEWRSLDYPEIHKFSLPSDGYDISCKLFAPPFGKPNGIVIGVHGFAGDKNSSVLTQLALALHKKQWALVCFDFPAHGDSTAPDDRLRVDNCKRDLLTVVSWAKTTYSDAAYGLFATSFGGYIASLCTEELSGIRKVFRAPAVTMATALEHIVAPTAVEELLENGAVCGFERNMHVSGALYRDLLEQPFLIPDEPFMIIHGTKDDVIPFAAVKQLSERCDHICLIAVEGADHRFKRPDDLEIILENSVSWLLNT